MTAAPVDPDVPGLRTRIAALERQLEARSKTVDVLTRRVRDDQSSNQSNFKMFRDNAALQHVLARQIDEIMELRRKVEAVALEREQQQKRRAELERNLAEASKLESLGRLAGGIAHEINTPAQYVGDNLRFIDTSLQELQPLLAWCCEFVEHAEAPARLPPEAATVDVTFLRMEMASAISQSLDGMKHIASIVCSMKEFSHPGTNSAVEVDVNHSLESALTIGRSEWKHVAVAKCEFDPALPRINAFPAELNQVFLNMIVNAAHAIEERHGRGRTLAGELTLRTRRIEEGVVIHIQDNGCGMTPDVKDRMFEPFFTTKPVGKGTGQGLTLVYRVIRELHHGRLDCVTAPGVGTTFTMVLPIVGPTTVRQA